MGAGSETNAPLPGATQPHALDVVEGDTNYHRADRGPDGGRKGGASKHGDILVNVDLIKAHDARTALRPVREHDLELAPRIERNAFEQDDGPSDGWDHEHDVLLRLDPNGSVADTIRKAEGAPLASGAILRHADELPNEGPHIHSEDDAAGERNAGDLDERPRR
ncbi:MAG: hypothetical protein ACLQBL_28600, partial [Polyangiaceae bacterium]